MTCLHYSAEKCRASILCISGCVSNVCILLGKEYYCDSYCQCMYCTGVCLQGHSDDDVCVCVCVILKTEEHLWPLPSKWDKTTTVRPLCWNRKRGATLLFLLMSRAEWQTKLSKGPPKSGTIFASLKCHEVQTLHQHFDFKRALLDFHWNDVTIKKK